MASSGRALLGAVSRAATITATPARRPQTQADVGGRRTRLPWANRTSPNIGGRPARAWGSRGRRFNPVSPIEKWQVRRASSVRAGPLCSSVLQPVLQPTFFAVPVTRGACPKRSAASAVSRAALVTAMSSCDERVTTTSGPERLRSARGRRRGRRGLLLPGGLHPDLRCPVPRAAHRPG